MSCHVVSVVVAEYCSSWDLSQFRDVV